MILTATRGALQRAARLLSRRSPWCAAAATAVVFNLILLWPQLSYIEPNSDDSLHMAMVRWAAAQFAGGHLPLDGWFANLNLGASQFHHYQSLPAILTAAISGPLGPTTTYLWVKYLLVCLWPVAVYASARLLDRSPAEAAIAALLSPLLSSIVGFGYEQTSYVAPGVGLYTQLWGMWTLPLAWGFSWRAIKGEGRLFWAAIFIALTIACHYLTAYLALLALPVMWLCLPRRTALLRAVTLGLAALALSAWVVVPLISDAAYSPLSEFERAAVLFGRTNPYVSQPGIFYDSFGAAQVLGWLFTGQLYDGGPAIAGRFALPVISLGVAVGLILVVARWRIDPAGRVLVSLWLVSLVLFIGPASLPILRLIPGGVDIQFHRYLMGLQMTGLYLAGMGGAWLCRECFGILSAWRSAAGPVLGSGRRDALALLSLAGLVVLTTPSARVVSFAVTEGNLISRQHSAEARDEQPLLALIADIKARGGGRVYAGAQDLATTPTLNTKMTLGTTPVYAVLANHDVDTLGVYVRTLSLSIDPLVNFDDSTTGAQQQGQYRLFNVRYVIQSTSTPTVPDGWTLLDTQGPYALWQVAPTTYVQIVDTIDPPITADRTNLGSANAAFMTSTDLAEGRYHAVAFNGQGAAPATLTNPPSAATPAGDVSSEMDGLTDGHVSADVTATRNAVAVLSASYDNRWTASVDGRDVATQMIAPSLLGVAVPAGNHHVEFTYKPYPLYWLWFLVAAVTMLILAMGTRVARAIRPAHSAPPVTALE